MSVVHCRGANRAEWMLPVVAAIGLAMGSISLALSPPPGKGQGPTQGSGGAAQANPDSRKPPASQPAVDEGRDREPEPYNLAAIDADPNYYNTANPNRLHQRAWSMEKGEKRPPQILIVSNAVVHTVADKKLDQPLAVKALPGRPVTFVAIDQGTFANGKYSITVKADKEGKASVEFTVAAPGAYRVQASSPENAGLETFQIYAYPPGVLEKMTQPDPERQERDRQIRDLEARKGGPGLQPQASQPAGR